MAIAHARCAERLTRVACVIEADFREMPGMRLTRAQAQRLWNISAKDCAEVLEYLTGLGRLVQDPSGQYCAPHVSY